jgi:hypothetical protein
VSLESILRLNKFFFEIGFLKGFILKFMQQEFGALVSGLEGKYLRHWAPPQVGALQ